MIQCRARLTPSDLHQEHDVGDPRPVGLRRSELSLQCLQGDDRGPALDHPRGLVTAQSLDFLTAHNSLDAILATFFAYLPQSEQFQGNHVPAAARRIRRTDQMEQLKDLDCPIR